MSSQLATSVGEIKSLTGLRGLAAWVVVVYHFRSELSGAPWVHLIEIFRFGYLAVDLFFVLSGFVIYVNYGDQFRSVDRRQMMSFYIRRIARIYPLHIVVLICFIVNPVAILFFSEQKDLGGRYDVGYFMHSVFLVQNWGWLEGPSWNIPAWSISTEFAAYLLFPFIALSIYLISRINRWLPCLLVFALPVFIIFFCYFAGISSLGDDIDRFGLLRCLFQFGLGACVAYLYLLNKESLVRVSYFSMFAAASFLFVVVLAGITADYVIAPFLFSLLILALINEEALFSKILSARPIHFLGLISYSTYLIHFLVKDWVKFLSGSVGLFEFFVYIFLVFCLSVFLYYAIELRLRGVTHRLLERAVGKFANA